MIKQVGSTEIKPKHRAACPCRTVVLELDLLEGIVDPRAMLLLDCVANCPMLGQFFRCQAEKMPEGAGVEPTDSEGHADVPREKLI